MDPLAWVGADEYPLRVGGAGMTAQEVSSRPLPLEVTPAFRVPVRRRDAVWIVAMTVLALALRVPYLGRAYWIDEGISIGISSHPLSQLPKLLNEDGSPPLFYVILHFWIRVFGTGEVATHFLPLTISLVTVPVAYWAGRRLFDRRIGLAAAALFATNPFLDWYATETRMYPLVVLLSLVGLTLAWLAFVERNPRYAAGAALSFVALLYTHDWGIYLTVVTAGVLFVLAVSQGDRRLAGGVAATSAVVAAAWLPWLPTFLAQARNTAAPWAVHPQIGDFFADPSSALGGTIGFVIAPLLAAGALWTRRHRPLDHGRVAGAFGAIGLLTTLAGFVGAQLEPSWTVRYLAVVVAPFLLASAAALGSSRHGRAVVWTVAGLLAIWGFIGYLLPNPNFAYAKSNVAAVAAEVSPKLHPGDVVVVTQTEQLAVLDHYLPAGLVYVTPTGPVATPYVVDWRDIVSRLQKADACQALGPTIDALPVGTDVLEIDPARALGTSGTAWSNAVNSQVFDDDKFLAHAPSLRAIGLYNPASSPKPYSPVDAVLFQKVNARAVCTS